MKLNMLGFLGFLGLLGSLGTVLNTPEFYGMYAPGIFQTRKFMLLK